MTIVAAFHWDSSTKAISYMIVNDNYSIVSGPVNRRIQSSDLEQFEHESKLVINAFFDDIEKYCTNEDSIRVEYKILNDVQPGQRNSINKEPNHESIYVRDTFHSRVEITEKKLQKKILVKHQLRKDISRPALHDFKNKLLNYELIASLHKEKYRWFLWALVLHATNKNYEKKLLELCKAITKQSVQPHMQKYDEANRKRV